jgi:cation:H+ antiporter
LDRLEGALLLVALVAFTAYSVHIARKDASEAEKAQYAQAVAARTLKQALGHTAVALFTVLLGIGLLAGGGKMLVEGAVAISRWAGMTERVIGLTVVAIGTGMPEVATSLIAAVRRQTDIAIANMIGSNIFNLLGILGVTAALAPIQVSPEMVRSDLWWMVGTAALLFPLMRSGMRISRLEGAALFVVYIVYLSLLL